MSIQDYESLRRARPELRLPEYRLVRRPDRRLMRRFQSRQELIGRRVAKLLRNEYGWEGRIQKRRLVKRDYPTTTLKVTNGK